MSRLTLSHACSTHLPYRLTCEDYWAVLDRAGFACERCEDTSRPLQVDHDHALGLAAVRGMVCQPCNLHLGRVDRGEREADEKDRTYLEVAGYRTLAAEYVHDGRTKHRAVRVDDELWQAAQQKAKRRRETVAAVIKRALVDYVEDEK